MSPHIEAIDLHRRFGQRSVLDGLSLTVAPGEICGLVGPDGAGKTTALRILAGLLAPTSGHARLIGRDPLRDRGVREALGYMPQQYSLYGDLTVDENLAFFREMFCLSPGAFRERKGRLLEMTRLAPFRSRRADALSGGMFKKLALACALLHQPKVLLLDEPTNGVDPVSRREFWNLLSDFLAEGVAILLSTPYMDEAARCHRTGLLHEGRLIEEGRPSDLVRAFVHPVFHVTGEHKALEALFEQREGVLAFTPAGAQLRIVVRRGQEETILRAVDEAGGRAVPALPTFEDLFLSRIHEQGCARPGRTS